MKTFTITFDCEDGEVMITKVGIYEEDLSHTIRHTIDQNKRYDDWTLTVKPEVEDRD